MPQTDRCHLIGVDPERLVKAHFVEGIHRHSHRITIQKQPAGTNAMSTIDLLV